MGAVSAVAVMQLVEGRDAGPERFHGIYTGIEASDPWLVTQLEQIARYQVLPIVFADLLLQEGDPARGSNAGRCCVARTAMKSGRTIEGQG